MKIASVVIATTRDGDEHYSFVQRMDGLEIEDELDVFGPSPNGVYGLKLSLPEGDERRRRFIIRLRQEPGLWHVEFRPHVPHWQRGDEPLYRRRRRAHHAAR